jgi:hypothetical protein
VPGTSIWERFTLDPRRAENARLRASDRDRDVVNDILGTAYAEGRLTPIELDERSDQVAQSKTLGELPAIIDDLVASSSVALSAGGSLRAQAEHRYRTQRTQALWGFLTPTLICWAIYIGVMGGGFPWPIFVTIASGARFMQLLTNREDTIISIERDLEKKERKRIEQQRRRQIKGSPDDSERHDGERHDVDGS